MVFYAAFNSILNISWQQLALFMSLGSEVSCPWTLLKKIPRIQCGSHSGSLDYKSNTFPLSHTGSLHHVWNEWMNEWRFTARRHQRSYWAHSQVTIINHTASCLDSNEIDQYQRILKQCKRAQIVYTDMVNTVSRCTYIPFYRTWLIIIVQQYYCMDRSSILKCFEGKEYFVPFFPFFHLYFWLCRWQLGGCTVSKDWSQRWVDLLCSFLNLWFELKFSYLLCTSNNA